MLRCTGGERTEEPVLDRVGDIVPSVCFDGPDTDALDEFLVAVRRMKLRQADRLLVAGQQPGQAARDVRLAGARHALKDELTLERQQAAGSTQPLGAEIGR